MRFKFLLLLILFSGIISANQNYDTILKMKTEQDIAARLENMLLPLIGRTMVVVDLELEYPSNIVQAFGMDLDTNESLPGLPVSRSTSAIFPQGTEKNNQVKIINKKIIIYINKKAKADEIDFVRNQVISWYDIDESRSDLLEINPILMPEKSGNPIRHLIVFGILFIIILLISTLNIKSALLYLAKSVKTTRISGIDQPLQIKGNMGSNLPPGFQQQATTLKFNNNKPVPIKIINEIKNEVEIFDFSFIEDLSIDDFYNLVLASSPDKIAFVFSTLNQDFLRDFYLSYPNVKKEILPHLVNSKPKTKVEVEGIWRDTLKLFKDMTDKIAYDKHGFTTLTNLLNNLPPDEANTLLNDINQVDPAVSNDLRSKLFLLDDIINIEDHVLEGIFHDASHDLLVSFLVSVDKKIQNKILTTMTPRAQMILEEDIQLLGRLSQEDMNVAIHEMLKIIRNKLNH